jgi:hypothetical protein
MFGDRAELLALVRRVSSQNVGSDIPGSDVAVRVRGIFGGEFLRGNYL